jgi:flagellar assembly protein FliH
LLVAAETTFLSKVIKQSDVAEHQICNVNFEVLLDNEPAAEGAARAYLEADGFRPLFFNDAIGPVGEEDRPSSGESLAETGDETTEETDEPSVDEAKRISEAEIQKLVAEAYARGIEEGRLSAERGLANVFKSLREGLGNLVELKEKVLRESEGDMLALAIMIARKIIMQEVRTDSQILARVVAATVCCCSEQDKITIRLNPDDFQKVSSNRQRFLGEADDGRIALASDDSIEAGGCLVETPTGMVDARISAQLDEVFARCLEERGIPQEPSMRLTDEVF